MFQAASSENTRLHTVAGGRGIMTFAVDASGHLELLGEQVTLKGGKQTDAGPCHVSTDKTGKWLFVCNYDDGSVAVLPIQTHGLLGEPVVYKHGPGAHEGTDTTEWGTCFEARQEAAHPHGAPW
eukprot:gnl/TRDRNA2_/TRDRNA2_86787_c0_seq2.p2 gnl/TRDRNA2_/TRDRNA2_86787_c0~~gnl/TRDRNA2_/TRDRNA2_86787_c0_seq2.p2  ORF type:complete len:133 (+),score=22.57 gnl/TRDRNA2_/TRDRNA2_86787_c0_seq2:30-401(+)